MINGKQNISGNGLWFFAIACWLCLSPAHAEELPLTIVVPFAAGGPTDRIAHAFAQSARRQLPEQTVIVKNVGGAGGTTGAAEVARAPADGSTVLLQNIAMVAAPSLYRDLPYQALTDFEYLGMLEEVPMMLIGRNTLPPTFVGFRHWAKEQQGAIKLAHAGVGSASHLCALLLQNALKQPMTQVTYTGNGPAMVDLISGQLDLLCDLTTNASAQIEAGKVRAYGVTSPTRVHTATLQSLPTFAELGLEGTEVTVWFALCAPAGTPQPVLDRLNALLRAVVVDPEFVKSQEEVGAKVIADERIWPETHKRFVSAELERWGPIIRAAGGGGSK